MRINHSHEGDLRITAHLHLNLMHEQVMKMVEKNWCDFSMEFAVFFAIFGNLMGFLPSWFLQGGAGRARKFNFERLTLVMRVLPLTNPFFSSHERYIFGDERITYHLLQVYRSFF